MDAAPASTRLRPSPAHWATAAVAIWGAVAVSGGMFAAQAALGWLAPVPAPRIAVSRIVPPPARVAPPVREALPPAPGLASPGQGATGTIALPALPATLPPVTQAALRPFSLASIAAVDRGRALECLATAVYYEAASESDAGQRAVAQVVLNRVRHPAFPATVCGVVYQGSERAGCQFSFACDGAMMRAPSRSGWARAMRNAALVLNGGSYAPVGLATHYHTFAVTPAWNRTLVMTDAVGAHFFHRWKGFWGTPAAFTQRYRGGEPVPGPHPPPTAPLAVPEATPLPEIKPAYAKSGAPLAPATDTPGPQALPESTILDRWKDAGKPLK